jgi:hypothetical protein
MKRYSRRIFAAFALVVTMVTFSVFVSAPALAQSPGPPHEAAAVSPGIDFETIDQGQMSYFRCDDACFHGVDMLIKDQPTLEWFWAQHTKGMDPPPDPPLVDFGTEMVMVTIMGFQPSSGIDGPSTEILGVDYLFPRGSTVHVLIEDDETQGILPVISNPYHIIRLSRIDFLSFVFLHQRP